MAVQRISRSMIERPKVPESGTAVTWDASPGMGGFGIRVSSSGRVSFIVRYWTGDRERWQTIGAYPRMNLTEARAKATGILRAAAGGGDPVEAERTAKAEALEAKGRTVAALAEEWMEALPHHTTRRGRRISPRTVESYVGLMKKHVLPRIGKMPITEVTRRDVAALHRAATKNGGPYSANRAVSVLGIFYGWAESIEAVPGGFNPCRRPPRNPEERRGEHAAVRLSREQEARLVAAIYKLMNDGFPRRARGGGTYQHQDPVGAAALLMLLDTGRRRNEVLALEWRRLDLDAGTADLGPTKGKAAGDVCYLTDRVRDAIRRLPRVVGCRYVFTGNSKGGRRSSLQSAWHLVKREAGLESISEDLEGFHLHDLRHHRISELLAAGVAPQLVARQVGHTSLDQLRTYGHLLVADVAAVLSRLPVVEPEAGGEVVAIEGR